MKQDTTKSVKQVFDDCFESAINTIAQQGGFVLLYFTAKNVYWPLCKYCP